MDWFKPYLSYSNHYTYEGLSIQCNPNSKERFISLGLNYSPAKNIHFMPNIWYNGYMAQDDRLTGAAKFDYNLAYKVTIYFVFGK